jgi:chaperonin cofactor prefoldin
MADPKDMILPMLREIREDMRSGFKELRDGQATIAKRMEKLEGRFDNLREAVNGESILGRYAVAEVETRLEAIEKRLTALETRG